MRGIFQGFSIEASAAIGAYECELSLWGVVQKGLSGRDAARAPWKNTMARRDMKLGDSKKIGLVLGSSLANLCNVAS